MSAAPSVPTELAQHRARLLADVPVTERQVDAAQISTAVLEAGDGPPVILLHGPGETAVNWRWTIPDLAVTHRAIAPDLPAHGGSGSGETPLDADVAVRWLTELVERTCTDAPVVVGHVLGGAIAARFAARHSDRLRGLVLVDSLGLARFRPSPGFAVGFAGFLARPGERSYERFMTQCAHDRDALARRMGEEEWQAFVAYNVGLARAEHAKVAGQLFRKAGTPPIPPHELERIATPTTLIRGRHDQALHLGIAERARARYGWPLHVIDDAIDDPARDQPGAFLRLLRGVLGG